MAFYCHNCVSKGILSGEGGGKVTYQELRSIRHQREERNSKELLIDVHIIEHRVHSINEDLGDDGVGYCCGEQDDGRLGLAPVWCIVAATRGMGVGFGECTAVVVDGGDWSVRAHGLRGLLPRGDLSELRCPLWSLRGIAGGDCGGCGGHLGDSARESVVVFFGEGLEVETRDVAVATFWWDDVGRFD